MAPAKFLNGETRVTSPNGAAESAIKINPIDTDVVIAGTNGPGSGQKMFYSTNGGASWSSAAALPQGGTLLRPDRGLEVRRYDRPHSDAR